MLSFALSPIKLIVSMYLNKSSHETGRNIVSNIAELEQARLCRRKDYSVL